MDALTRYHDQIDDIRLAFQKKLKLRPAPYDRMLARAKPRLPRRVYRNAQALADAQPMAEHPKLSRTLDFQGLDASADLVLTHLDGIDLADERKGKLLSVLGSLSINLIAVVILLIAVLMWRGFL